MAQPFLKWAGGKARLAPEVVQRAGGAFARYHEPFLGGGAVFFAFRGEGFSGPANLGDANPALISCYETVRDRLPDLVAALRTLACDYLPRDHEGRRDLFYAVREREEADPVAAAARLIFLNRTCYNGLYRVNRAGRFNVPHGRYVRPAILDEERLRAASADLRRATLRTEDFEAACARARRGDLVYLDPPYQPLSRTAAFTQYTSGSFGPPEQARLAEAFERLTRRGVRAILSNSDHPAIRALYEGRGYTLEQVSMSRAINSRTTARAPIPELLVSNVSRAEVARGG